MAFIKSFFTRNADDDGVLYVKADTIMVYDSIWQINDDCSIVFDDNRIEINSLMMHTKSQSMALNGYFPKTDADTLNIKTIVSENGDGSCPECGKQVVCYDEYGYQ